MKKERILSVDMLRGWVMIVMALDHIRDYSSMYHFDPEDLTQTNVPLFFTRWITHFCAPVFMFVAGVGTGLGEINGKTKKELSHFLWTRGLWLILLEFTVIRFGWYFNMDYSNLFLLVIWALGICMIFLALFIYLPKKVVLIGGLILVFGHNLLDPIQPESLGSFGSLWTILHEQSAIAIGSFNLMVIYPLIPWIGVMALGYVFADFYKMEPAARQKKMIYLGSFLTLLFLVFRGFNIYGDENPWSPQSSFGLTVVSFFNATKYPPSLIYLLMTLGPSIILLAFFEKIKGRVSNFLIVFGRVPMFYYVLHLYLIHVIAIILGLSQGFTYDQMANVFFQIPPEFGFSLPVTYLLWFIVVVTLYPLCVWYMRLKKKNPHPVFSYI